MAAFPCFWHVVLIVCMAAATAVAFRAVYAGFDIAFR